MKPASWLCAALWAVSSACLGRDEVGAFLPPSACDAGQCVEDASVSDPRYEKIAEMLRDLAQGEWVGEARSGRVAEACRFVFQLDGSYTVTVASTNGVTAAFLVLFPTAVEGRMDGHYQVNDEVKGEFFGQFRDPFTAGIELLSDLRHLSQRNDTLSFERRSLAADLSLVTTQVVLKRER